MLPQAMTTAKSRSSDQRWIRVPWSQSLQLPSIPSVLKGLLGSRRGMPVNIILSTGKRPLST